MKNKGLERLLKDPLGFAKEKAKESIQRDIDEFNQMAGKGKEFASRQFKKVIGRISQENSEQLSDFKQGNELKNQEENIIHPVNTKPASEECIPKGLFGTLRDKIEERIRDPFNNHIKIPSQNLAERSHEMIEKWHSIISPLEEAYSPKELVSLDRHVRKVMEKYANSSIVVNTKDIISGKMLNYDLIDFGLILAIRNLDGLIVGGAGSGKTLFGYALLTSLYGNEGFSEKTITPGLDVNEFTDLDFGAIKNGKLKSEALKAKPILNNPAILINEPNRVVEELQNLFIGLLDYEFENEGIKFPMGVMDRDGKPYQLRMFTMNIGEEYSGTAKIDHAIKTRSIGISIDDLIKRREDIAKMRKNGHVQKSDFYNKRSCLPELLGLKQFTDNIALDKVASMYSQYLSNLDTCIKTDHGRKSNVKNLRRLCDDGCHHNVADKQVCGNIRGLEKRSIDFMISAAKGVALFRSYKVADAAMKGRIPGSVIEKYGNRKGFVKAYLSNLSVLPEDIRAAAPLVMFKHMPFNQAWLQKQFSGSEWNAAKYVADVTYNRFMEWHAQEPILVERAYSEIKLSLQDKEKIEKRIMEKDAWAFDLGYLKD